jgi:hypothetical protein
MKYSNLDIIGRSMTGTTNESENFSSSPILFDNQLSQINDFMHSLKKFMAIYYMMDYDILSNQFGVLKLA